MTQSLSLTLNDHHRAVLDLSLPQALEYAATQWTDDPAIVFIEGESVSLTWGELALAVGRLRTGLEDLGVQKGDRVGVLLTNRVEFPLTWLAVTALGAAIVPLNPKYTSREASFVLDDAGATWLVGEGDLISAIAIDSRVASVAFDHVVAVGSPVEGAHAFDEVASVHMRASTSTPLPDDIANIQFTSGTTGLPKGCLLTHRYWIELGVYSDAYFEGPRRTLADHPFHYMQNQAYLASALVSGGAIYVTRGLSRRKFLGWLIDYEIDSAWIDEGMLDQPISDHDQRLALKRAPVSAIPPGLHAQLEQRFALRARDLYASTEVGHGTAAPWDRDDLVGTGTMGLAFPHRETKIIGSDLNEVPAGVPGELCVRGSGLMLGYHNRPEANAELFLPGGWFRTGDVVRKDADGLHYYIGRSRDMIRRSGENIAAVEIEMQILEMPEVFDVAAVPVPDPDRGEEVKVLVVRAPGADVAPEAIIAWARRVLAPFKVPRYIEFRDELPYTASGKVAKAQLKAEEPLHAGVFDSATAHTTRTGD